MIDENTCETLYNSNNYFVVQSLWSTELEKTITEYYRMVLAKRTHGKQTILSEKEQIDYAINMLNHLMPSGNLTANVGIMSIGKRYKMFDMPSNLQPYQVSGFIVSKFQPLLYHSARWLKCSGMSEKHLIKHSIEYNTMLLHHLGISAYAFAEYKTGFGLMFSVRGWRSSNYKLTDLRFWWLLVNRIDVSEEFLKDYALLFGFTEPQLKTKLRAFFKKCNVQNTNLLTHIPNEQPRILKRLSELKLI